MLFKIFSIFFISILSLNATNYITTSKAMATDKKSACQKALNNAREDALSQAGTLVISNFSSNSTDNNGKYTSISNSDLKAISVGVAKLVSRNETVKVTKGYQFYCSVDAVFSIDEDSIKKAMNKYLTSINKEQNKNFIYIKAEGYSEEGQSRYRAIKVATIDAKRNLLDEIKGSKLFSIIELDNGQLEIDKVINSAKGTIQFVKVISKRYDNKTRSAIVTVGMTEENLAKNIKRWQEN